MDSSRCSQLLSILLRKRLYQVKFPVRMNCEAPRGSCGNWVHCYVDSLSFKKYTTEITLTLRIFLSNSDFYKIPFENFLIPKTINFIFVLIVWVIRSFDHKARSLFISTLII